VFHAHQGKFRVKTELEQYICSECTRFLANCIIFYNTFILSALMAQAEKTGEFKEAEVIKVISPIAWRHVNLLGRFEFQRPHNPIDIDEMIKVLGQEIVWQRQKPTDELLEK
jgi:hypothetical protein